MITSGSFTEDVAREVVAPTKAVSEILIPFLGCLTKKKKRNYIFKCSSLKSYYLLDACTGQKLDLKHYLLNQMNCYMFKFRSYMKVNTKILAK
jgi:hypothetical protein